MGVCLQALKLELFEINLSKVYFLQNYPKMVVVSSLGPPEEGVVHKEMNVTTFINEKRIGKGTLYISEALVTWVGDASAANHTFSLEYNHISVHAISRDAMVFPHTECLYLMIDAKLVDSVPGTPASTPETSDDDDEADDGEGMTEIRFAPDDKATLQVMFSSMSHCQTLHPDPEAAEDAADEEAENDEVRFPAMFCFWVSVHWKRPHTGANFITI